MLNAFKISVKSPSDSVQTKLIAEETLEHRLLPQEPDAVTSVLTPSDDKPFSFLN